MNTIYLRYKNAPLDPWTTPPDLSSAFPGLPSDALPLEGLTFATEPALTSTCNCSAAGAADDHYIMHVTLAPIPQALSVAVMNYLLNYKTATYHETKQSRYLTGVFQQADLTFLVCKEKDGMSEISFRIGVGIAAP